MLPTEVWKWEDGWTELYVERSAIMQHDGCISREAADFSAQMCIRRMEQRDEEEVRDLQTWAKSRSSPIPRTGELRVRKDRKDRQGIPELI